MLTDELIKRAGWWSGGPVETRDLLVELVRHIQALENAVQKHGIYIRDPKLDAAVCDGHHPGHPCGDRECWVIKRYLEQQEGQ